jgi:hypothetical protein
MPIDVYNPNSVEGAFTADPTHAHLYFAVVLLKKISRDQFL